MRVPTATKRGARGTRVQPQVGNSDVGLAQGIVAVGDVLHKQAVAAQATRAAQADLSYVNGKMSQTTVAFKLKRDELREKYGNDSLQYVEEYGQFTRDFIDQIASDAPNEKTKNRLFTQLNTLQLSELKSSSAERDKAFKDINTVLLQEDLNITRTAIRDNWREWEAHYTAGISMYRNARESFLEETEFTEGVRDYTSNISKDVVTGWFREQNGKLALVKDIREGTLKDPNIQLLYNQLRFDEREALASRLMKEYIGDVKAENSLSKNEDDSGKINFNNQVLQFYLAPKEDDLIRQEIFENIKLSKHMDPERLIKLQQILAGFDSADAPETVFNVRYRIETGDISSPEQLLDVIGEGLSFDTARELLPVISAKSDARFQNAKRLLNRALGIPEGIIVFDPNEPKREEQGALEDLERFYAANPDGDFVGKANAILVERQARIEAQRDKDIIKRKDQLSLFELEYEKNPTSAMAEKIAAIKRAITRLESQ